MTVEVPDFQDWRKSFDAWGRVKRNEKGEIMRIVELEDCTEGEKEVHGASPGFYCFQARWLWNRLEVLKNNNAQGEYYLTDLLGMAFAEGKKIAALRIEPKIAIGISTAEEFAIAASLIKKQKRRLI